MTLSKVITEHKFYIIGYFALASVFVAAFGFAFSSFLVKYPELAIGVTYDLTLTAPLIYLALIWKTRIPKTTVVPVFVIGMVIASYLIPAENQFHLGIIKTWILPIVEISVVSFVAFSVYKTVKTFRNIKDKDSDFLTILQKTCNEKFDIKFLAHALAFEIAVVYYSFLSWKKFTPSKTTFSYHKNSGKTAFFGAVIFLIVAETVVLHILVAQWNDLVAWILTLSSAYVALQLFGHVKAIFQRPIEIIGDRLFVRYGLFVGTEIPLNEIESVEFTTLKPEKMEGVRHVSFLADLEQFNVKLELKNERVFSGFYGIEEKYSKLLLFVDDRERFREMIEPNVSN